MKAELSQVEQDFMADVLTQSVAISDELLKPLPVDWIVAESVFFLAQCAAMQRNPVDDLIQASMKVTEITGYTLSESQLNKVMDWAQSTLDSGHLTLGIIKHSSAITGLGPNIVKNHIFPMLEYLAINVGDSTELNSGVINMCATLWACERSN